MDDTVISTATQAAAVPETGELPPLPPATAATVDPVAYSAAEPEPADAPRATGRRVAALLTAILATSSGITAAILLLGHHRPSSPPAADPAPAPYVPKLNGAYRMDYDWPNQTYRYAERHDGKRVTWDKTPDDTPHSTWWAFSSTCTQTGCIATGTQLNNDDHRTPLVPASTDVMRLVEGVWRDVTPVRSRSECRADQDNSVTGHPLVSMGWEFALLPNSTFRGTMTETVETDECGSQGNTILTPMTATRIGDVPTGVVFDVNSAPQPSAPPPPTSVASTTTQREPATTSVSPPGAWTDAELAPYDAQVRSRMEAAGFHIDSAAAMARAGHAVCAQIQSGVTPDVLVQPVANQSGINPNQARFFIDTAMAIYPGCS